ncbi:MAG: metallophosphoesterase [Armatimonadetes bacterium]|nr:metallophosphoesterase [Armatimonadota bacterium]
MSELAVIHTADLHGRLTTTSAALLRDLKERYRALLLDSGDFTALPNFLAVPWRIPVVSRMATAGYDAAALGNREWFFRSFGVRWIASRLPFPLVASNVVFPPGSGVAELILLPAPGGQNVAVIALARCMVDPRSALQHLCDSRWQPPGDALRRLVPRAREQADWVVVLSHLGLFSDLALAQTFSVDLVLGGHDHVLTTRAIPAGRAAVVHSGCHGAWATVIGLARHRDGVRIDVRPVRLIQQPECRQAAQSEHTE